MCLNSDENEDDDEGRLFLRQPRNLSGGGKENPDMNLNGRLEYEWREIENSDSARLETRIRPELNCDLETRNLSSLSILMLQKEILKS